jgi:hypothetical protein
MLRLRRLHIRRQQNLERRRFAQVKVTTNRWTTFRDNIADVPAIIETVFPCSYATFRISKPPRL